MYVLQIPKPRDSRTPNYPDERESVTGLGFCFFVVRGCYPCFLTFCSSSDERAPRTLTLSLLLFPLSSSTLPIINPTDLGAQFFSKDHEANSRLTPTDGACLLRAILTYCNSAAANHPPRAEIPPTGYESRFSYVI